MSQIETSERDAAVTVLCTAESRANDGPDFAAETVAILVAALELATPDLSAQRRAELFLHHDNEVPNATSAT